jgi:hypothetical protein
MTTVALDYIPNASIAGTFGISELQLRRDKKLLRRKFNREDFPNYKGEPGMNAQAFQVYCRYREILGTVRLQKVAINQLKKEIESI